MSSLGELIHYVRSQLTGLGTTSDSVTALAGAVDPTQLSIPVEDAQGLAGGTLVEVDAELIRLKSADPSSGLLTAYPFGRGYQGTTATAHEAGVEVTLNPTFPTAMLAREINGVLSEIYPRVYAVRTVDLPPNPPFIGLGLLPDEAVGVISVWVQDRIHGHWIQERDWSYSPDHKQLSLRAGLADHAFRVVYAARPETFTSLDLTQDFTTVTGLDARVADLLAMGVAVRLAPMIDIARLPFATAEARDMGDGRSSGGGAAAARLLYSMFQARVESESAILAKEHPIKTNRTR